MEILVLKAPKLCSCGKRLEGSLVDYLTYDERRIKAVKCVWCKRFNEIPAQTPLEPPPYPVLIDSYTAEKSIE